MKTCFFTKSVKFGFGELSICRICAESRDLGPGHGFRACSFKNKGKKLDFHIFGVQKMKKMKKWMFALIGFKKTNKNRTNMNNWDEIGQIVVSGALDDTKKMRKASADTFAKSGLEKTSKKRRNQISPDFTSFFPHSFVDLS